ncbi:MAG TPA: aminodeoxychorismate lyase [Usitatibacter sp.]|nr:aminodeoxychorismate lyase [Usitatibacter sp.]
MTAAVLVNGEPAERIAVNDRGFAFGDGVFRTLLVRRGRALNWGWHFRRLAADCAALELVLPPEGVLLAEIARLAPTEATVKVIVTRGAAGRGYASAAGAPCTRVVAVFPPPPHAAHLRENGVWVRRCRLVLSEQPRLAGAKTLNRLENVLARNEWKEADIAEGLLTDRLERLIEGTMSNVFVVKDGRIATPELSRCGVIGAQRERVRDLLAREGIACEERDVAFSEIEAADEVFLTNSLIGVWPVRRLAERHWIPGPLTRRIQAWVETDDALA